MPGFGEGRNLGQATAPESAEIYSLGVVFYEMLTGELPVGQFPPPSVKAQLDVRLDQVVLRAPSPAANPDVESAGPDADASVPPPHGSLNPNSPWQLTVIGPVKPLPTPRAEDLRELEQRVRSAPTDAERERLREEARTQYFRAAVSVQAAADAGFEGLQFHQPAAMLDQGVAKRRATR